VPKPKKDSDAMFIPLLITTPLAKLMVAVYNTIAMLIKMPVSKRLGFFWGGSD
jgi:hypothetical protein